MFDDIGAATLSHGDEKRAAPRETNIFQKQLL
jgi:hypothetical protein